MNNKVDHVIEVRVWEDGNTLKHDPFSPSSYESPVAPQSRGLGATASKTIALQIGKQALGYALSSYGDLTGDYVTQTRISESINALGTASIMFSSPLGFAVGGMGMLIDSLNLQIQTKTRNQEAEFLRARTGMLNYSGGRDI